MRERRDRPSRAGRVTGHIGGSAGQVLRRGRNDPPAAASTTDREAGDAGDKIVRLDGDAGDLLDTLAASLAVLNEATAPISESYPADLIAIRRVPTSGVARACRDAASVLVRFAAQRDGGRTVGHTMSELRSAKTALIRATTEFANNSGASPPNVAPDLADGAFADAAELLSEAGAEEYDELNRLGFDRESGVPILAISHATPAAVDTYLLSRLFQRLEVSLVSEPFLLLERAAAAWRFARWSAEPRDAAMDFTRGVREQNGA